MVLLIDPPLWPAHGRRWSHLVSDASLAELHAFATTLGIPARGFEGDHYDVPEERYADVVVAGAIPVSSRDLLRRLQASGLRRPKRRGERVLTSRLEPTGASRIDTLQSAKAPLGPVTAVHLLLVSGSDVLVVPDGEGFELPRTATVPGEPDLEAAQRLLAALLDLGELLDLGGLSLPPSRVGYLRHVPLPPSGDALGERSRVETVVRAGAIAPADARGAQWVDGGHATALLSPQLSSLVHLER